MINKLYLTKLLFKQQQGINILEPTHKNPQKIDGLLYFKATKNNTFVSIATEKYTTVFNYSLGQAAKKNTDTKVVINNYFSEYLAMFLHKHYIRNILISFTGGNNIFRNNIIQNLLKYNLKILEIRDCTKLPHNGCKLKSQQRGKYFYKALKSAKRFH
jgi:small subunit ribosomal protein S11